MNRFKNLAYAGLALTTPTVPGGVSGTAVTLTNLQTILTTVAQFLIVVSMVIAVIMIIYGGIRWMLSPDDSKAAKAIVTNGLIGAAIVLAVGVLLQTITYVVGFRG